MSSAFDDTVTAARQRAFPMKLSDAVTAHLSDRASLEAVFKQHFDAVFPARAGSEFKPSAERLEALARLRDNFQERNHFDRVVFKQGEDVVGWFVGEQADGISYYMRNTGILPAHHGQGLYTAFLRGFLPYLRELGFERVTSQHLGHNNRVLIPKLKAGFVITGFDFDERFGPLVRLTHYLHPDRSEFARGRMV